MAKLFDVAVIGAGPAGYVAAIRCAQLGLNTVCIDEWVEYGRPSLGGTCLNVGCIPSKALLESSENVERVAHKFPEHGIVSSKVHVDLDVMLDRKDNIVKKLTDGIGVLFRKNKVNYIHGHGRLVSAPKSDDGSWQLAADTDKGEEQLEARYVIVATGSVPTQHPLVAVDNELVVDNAGALAFREVPERLGVIGMGVIALELGSVWRRLGSKVTLLKSSETFLPTVDEQVAKEAWRIFSEQGLDMRMGAEITDIKVDRAAKKASKQSAKKDKKSSSPIILRYRDKNGEQKLAFDKLIIAIGRSPNTNNIGAEKVGLKLDKRGFIDVDEQCRTNLPNVFAVGDVVRGAMLAHKGSEEGVAVAELIAGQAGHVNYETIPWVIYTSPEIAWVGKTEQELKKAGVEYRKGLFPFSINGRSLGLGETQGFVKMIADAKTDRVLGVHIIGPWASEMITEAVVGMEYAASSEDIARIVHAHPSLSEVFHEAALAVAKRAIHS